jgi:hypothetical protein
VDHAAAAQLDVQNDMTFGAVKVVVLSFETLSNESSSMGSTKTLQFDI